MNLEYEQLIAGTNETNSDSGSEVARKVNDNFSKTLNAFNGKQDVLISSGAAVGQIAKITAVDASGKPTTWGTADMPGLKLAGVAQSPGADGKYNVPIATQTGVGIVKGNNYNTFGVSISADGELTVSKASNQEISGRSTNFKPIVPTALDFAVKAALCDGVGEEWTTAEKQAAMTRMGVDVETWTFTLDDDTTVTKTVVVKS